MSCALNQLPPARTHRPLWLVLLAAGALSGCLAHHTGPMPGEPADATYTQLAGARVRYAELGNPAGPPVVLIHGFASSLETWLPVAPALASTHRLIALDLKGFGWTDRPAGDYSPAAQAALVFALLDELGVDHAAVVAHSWGCSVALAMALEHPERVERLALYDAWVYGDQLPSAFWWMRADGLGEALVWLFYKERPAEKLALAFYDPTIVPESLVDEVERALDRPGTEAAALAAIRGQRFEEVEARYRTVAQPTLLLWGRDDKVTRLPFGERLLKELPDARLVTFAQVGHFPMLEAIGASNAVLAEFLRPAVQGGMAAQHAVPATTGEANQVDTIQVQTRPPETLSAPPSAPQEHTP